MTLVEIRVKQPTPSGNGPAMGSLYWAPTKVRMEDDTIILPKPFKVDLVDGLATVDVDPTTASWVWMVEQKFFGFKGTIYVQVPPDGPVQFTSLIQVDPKTLEQTDPSIQPIWYAYVDQLAQDAQAARSLALESKGVVVGETGNASTYATDALTSRNLAQEAATTATQKAGQAQTSATNAASAKNAAISARDDAATSATDAAQSASAAQSSEEAASTHKDAAQLARQGAETARADASNAKADAEAARDAAEQFHSTTVQLGYVDNTGHLVLQHNDGTETDAGFVVGPPVDVGVVETNSGPAAPGTVGAQGLKGDKGDPGGIVITDLANVDLNNITTPGVYRQGTGANATLANNYPAALVGTLMVLDRGVTRAVQIYYPIDGVGTFRWSALRTQTSTGWGPWSFQATSRVDQTAGRAVYSWDTTNNREQLIYGDTGSRTVNEWVDAAKFTVNVCKIRRVGSQVELRLSITPLSGISGNHQVIASLPVGFRNQHTYNVVGVDGTNVPMTATIAFAGGAVNLWNIPANKLVTYTFAFQTYDPWPTTLPGTADGTVINN